MDQEEPEKAVRLSQQTIDALGYVYRPDETTEDPDLDRPVTPGHCDYGDEYDFPVLEIREAAGGYANVGGAEGREPVAFAVAAEDDGLEAMRLLSLVVAPSGHVLARLHFAPEDYDDYRITGPGGVVSLGPE